MKNALIVTILSSLLILLAGCNQQPETLVTDGYDQSEMDEAISRAQQEVDSFILVLNSGDADSFSVKAPISEGDEVEHFWITDVSFEGGYFTGKIGNDPGIVKNVEFGQEWKIKKDDISDWIYTRGSMMHGGYTIDPLLVTMPEDQAAAMRARLVR